MTHGPGAEAEQDPAREYRLLRLALKEGPAGQVLFVQVSARRERRELPERLQADGLRRPWLLYHFGERPPDERERFPARSLSDFLLQHPSTEILYVDGVELRPDFHVRHQAHDVLEKLNLGREELGRLPAVVVFLMPAFLIELAERFAADLWSWRANFFVLDRPLALESQVWHIPAPTAYFTGREAQVESLRQTLRKVRRAAAGQVQAISGLGGIGKTQLALEYARRYKREYVAGFFLRAESLHGSLVEMAGALDLPTTEPAELLGVVLGWLKEYGPWLLVLDSADTGEALAAIKPLCAVDGQGHVIVTTRLRNTSTIGIAKPLRLHRLEPEESQRFLLQRTGREDAGVAELAAAAEIAEELDHLPLAMEQAGAYITDREMLFADYLGAFRLHRLELLKERPVAGDYPASVATTWSLNLLQVRKASSIAAAVMELSAFLAPDAIPEELLLMGSAELGPKLAAALSGAGGEAALDNALAPLLKFSLIERQPEQRTYSIHRLVQHAIQASLGEPAKRQWAERVVRALAVVFPIPQFENWRQCERLVEQAKTAFALINRWDLVLPEAARLLKQAAGYLSEQAQNEEAAPLLQRALAINEAAWGSDHLQIATDLNNLANLYKDQGKYEEAAPLLQRALAILEKALPPDHPNVAQSLNNLADLYEAQGRHGDAQKLRDRSPFTPPEAPPHSPM